MDLALTIGLTLIPIGALGWIMFLLNREADQTARYVTPPPEVAVEDHGLPVTLDTEVL